MRINVEVFNNGDSNFIDMPTEAEVSIDIGTIESILFDMDICNKYGFLHVVKESNMDDCSYISEDGEAIIIEELTRKIFKESVTWEMTLKYNYIKCFTKSFSKTELIGMKKILKAPMEDIPTYINDENKTVRVIARKRLEGLV